MIELHPHCDGVEVTFRLAADCGARQACVVGEFNDWSTDAHPMRLEGDEFVLRLRLVAGKTYRFRYLVDSTRWQNDWAAHAYVPNEFGGDASFLDLTMPGRVNSAPGDGSQSGDTSDLSSP